MGFRNTETRLHRPETGKPLTRSWTDAVTNNLNHESTTPGGFSEGPNLNPSHPSPYINPVTLRVKNHTNAPQEMFSVLKITTPEETNPNAFPHVLRSQQNAIYGETPTGDCHESVAITTYYMDPETELPCIVSGPSPVKILFETEESLTFPFAIPIYGDTTKLKASPFGRIKILWHEETQQTPTCSQPIVLYSWVNLGIQCEWSFWKLKADLACCSGTLAQLCDECGAVINEDCPIEAMIYAPPGQTLCSCEDSCAMWKAGDVVPALWYEYLCKWVTIPNFNINLEEKEMQVVTGLSITGGTIRPTENYNTVITDIVFNTNYVTLDGFQDKTVSCSGSLNFGNDAKAKGSVTVTGTIGSVQNPIELEVTSQSNLVTIYDASLTCDSNISLTGQLSGSATVSVPLNNVSLGVSGTASGPLTLTNGNVSLDGSCVIPFNNLPQLNVTGNVIKTSQADPVTLGGHSTKTLLSGATINTTTHNLKIPPLTGTLTGSLRTGSGVPTTNADRSGLRATIDLSSIFEMAEAVKEGTLDVVECELTYETINVLKFKQGKTAADLQNIPVTFQGDITVPSSVSCNFDYSETGATTTTIKGVDTSTNNGLTTTTDSVSIPTTATLHLDKIGVTGTAEWPQTLSQTGLVGRSHVDGTVTVSNNNVSLNVSGTATGSSGSTATGTVTITDTVTVSGPLSISSGVYIRGQFIPDYPMKATGTIPNVSLSTAQDVELGLSGSIVDNRTCTVPVPTSIKWGDEDYPWVDIDTARVPFPGIDLTGATISTVTDTITYLACADCPEPEEEEE